MSTPSRRILAVGAALATCAALAACGTPAAIKPVANPLPGLGHDINAAKGAVAQTERAAQADGGNGVSLP